MKEVQPRLAKSRANQGGHKYNTIMVPTDCSGFDREAVRVALRIADRSEAKVRLGRVLSTGAFFGAAASPDSLGASVVT
ncbi:MAG: universal stress protein [Gemmatimonadales bacterium]